MEHGYELSDAQWEQVQPVLPSGRPGTPGINTDNRLFINAVLWILWAGSPWRALPERFGKWNSVYRRFARWAKKGYRQKVVEVLSQSPEMKWLIVDSTVIRARQHSAGKKRGPETPQARRWGILKVV